MATQGSIKTAICLSLLFAEPLIGHADTLPDSPLEVCTTDSSQAGSAAAVTNSNIVQGDNTLFASYYSFADTNSDTYPDMTGDLKAFSIDATTGAIGNTPLWSALTKLDAWATGNQNQNNRVIYSNSGSALITLTANNFCNNTANQSYLGATDSPTCENIVSSLKGATVTGYRTRVHNLGTIVHSEPVYISNLKRVIQSANDGMVHAFIHDGTTSNGVEAWSYIPKSFLHSVGQADANKITDYINTTYTTHKFWLDATPAIETFTDTSGNTPTYENYFASGYGKGAKGVFALTLAASSPTPKWQFNTGNDSHVGYLYGRPIITKVNDSGSDAGTLKKVAIFASGFDNTDLASLSSSSYLYVVDLSTTTPTVLKTFTVSGKGLNYIAGYADSYSTLNQVKYVYGGDLEGNVWRFDLTGTTTDSWTVHKLASLGAPITSEPELTEITISGTPKRFVYVGTGRYLTSTDISSGETGSMYGLIDRIDTVTEYDDGDDATTPNQLSTVTLASSSYATTADPNTGTAANISSHGWKAQLPTGQRVINSPTLANGIVLFTANKPANACSTGDAGMESWLYAIDYKTGLQTAYYSLANAFSGTDKNFLASRPTVIKLSSGEFKAMIRTTDGETIKVDIGTLLGNSSGSGIAKGVFWREVITE